MFRLSLVLRKKDETELVLKLPIGFRIMFAVIVAFLLGSMISTGGTSTGSVVLTVLSLLAGLYKELWRFDKRDGVIVHESGLLFPYITRQYKLDDIDYFVLSSSKTYRPSVDSKSEVRFGPTMGGQRRRTTMTSFGLVTKDGKAHTIELRKSRADEAITDNVQEISDFCEIPVKFQE